MFSRRKTCLNQSNAIFSRPTPAPVTEKWFNIEDEWTFGESAARAGDAGE